ncbi:unnamed protein product [Boreogadus saida]
MLLALARDRVSEASQALKATAEKCEEDMEREARLVEQWVGLTEERNAVLVPAPGGGFPGAPAHWTPPAVMEAHIPVLFLDLNVPGRPGLYHFGRGRSVTPL